MSAQLLRLVNDLQGNMEVIGHFIENPKDVVAKYEIVGAEAKLILARDLEGLHSIGIDPLHCIGILSGAHTQQCTCHHHPNC